MKGEVWAVGMTVYWDGYSQVESGKVVFANEKNVALELGTSRLEVKERSSCFTSRVETLMCRAKKQQSAASDAMREANNCTAEALKLAGMKEASE